MADGTPPARPRRRVVFVIDRLAGRSGGAERILIETANGLAARGHEVQIVSHEAREGAPFYPLALGVMHINLRRPKAVRNRLRRRLDALRERLHREVRAYGFPAGQLLWLSKHGAFWRRLERHLAAHAPDVAVAFLPPAITALGLARPLPGLRRVASLHNVPEHDLANPERWDPSPVDRRRRMAALGRHDAITVLLPEFRDWFPAPLRERVAIMPNPVPPVPAAHRAAARREKVVLSVGRLAPVKRHDVLIAAFGRVAAEFPDWELRIFGVGPARAALAEAVRAGGLGGRVRLMGHTDRIADEYLAAAIVAHPAEHEGWGLAVTEALAAGTPPVGFADCPGVNALIEHGVTGLLVEPGAGTREARVAALAAALAGLMRDEAARAALGAAGPASMARFAPDRVLDRWEELVAAEVVA
jgi:glycosyltransferase involved in cell wall biosynthesis